MPQPLKLLRFTLVERWVHRTTAVLMGVCLVTAAILYVGALSRAIGYRAVVEWVHVIAGLSLPAPFVVGLLAKAFRDDVRRLNRFTPADWEWLRSRDFRATRTDVGKFNAGQKLNANFQLGAIFVMMLTGSVMRFANHWPIDWRTGATFAHDWTAYAILAVVLGHIYMALRDPDALAGMRTGYVPAQWAASEHGRWAAEHEIDAPARRGVAR
ncbi:MAG TPA: cytochrome b/b6 domain-containing protein [Acidothermaceae bacterium]